MIDPILPNVYTGGRVTVEECAIRVCFVPLKTNAPKIFGFSEFLAGLALMVLAWTIADTRYRFRIRSAPIPLQGLTFAVVSAVGALTLLTDLWRAQGWLVPNVTFFNLASWQAFLAGLYFLTFLTWVYFAFLKPARFSRWNAKRYVQTLFGAILKSSPAELAVVADELRRSAETIVLYATDTRLRSPYLPDPAKNAKKPPRIADYANELLSLIADKRFCRAIVASSPGTAWAFFGEMGQQKKYGIQIQTLANNIVSEALENKDSFLYHETAGYDSGLIGRYKPLCNAIFSNYQMVETIDTLLDPDFASRSKWDGDQWEAYCRIVLMTFSGYTEAGNAGHSYVLHRALEAIGYAPSDLYKLNGMASSHWNDDVLARLRAVIKFIKDVIEILEKNGVPADLRRRPRGHNPIEPNNIYDDIANLVYEVIFEASAVNSPTDLCWGVQHNAVWGELFNFGDLNGKIGSAVKSRVCRLLYNEVIEMNRFPNFKGARILAYCLNVMGLARGKGDYYNDTRALQKAILIWVRKNFAWLHNYDPRVAEACLADGMTYDAANYRIVRTYPVRLGQRVAQTTYFNVDPPPPTTEKREQ